MALYGNSDSQLGKWVLETVNIEIKNVTEMRYGTGYCLLMEKVLPGLTLKAPTFKRNPITEHDYEQNLLCFQRIITNKKVLRPDGAELQVPIKSIMEKKIGPSREFMILFKEAWFKLKPAPRDNKADSEKLNGEGGQASGEPGSKERSPAGPTEDSQGSHENNEEIHDNGQPQIPISDNGPDSNGNALDVLANQGRRSGLPDVHNRPVATSTPHERIAAGVTDESPISYFSPATHDDSLGPNNQREKEDGPTDKEVEENPVTRPNAAQCASTLRKVDQIFDQAIASINVIMKGSAAMANRAVENALGVQLRVQCEERGTGATRRTEQETQQSNDRINSLRQRQRKAPSQPRLKGTRWTNRHICMLLSAALTAKRTSARLPLDIAKRFGRDKGAIKSKYNSLRTDTKFLETKLSLTKDEIEKLQEAFWSLICPKEGEPVVKFDSMEERTMMSSVGNLDGELSSSDSEFSEDSEDG